MCVILVTPKGGEEGGRTADRNPIFYLYEYSTTIGYVAKPKDLASTDDDVQLGLLLICVHHHNIN